MQGDCLGVGGGVQKSVQANLKVHAIETQTGPQRKSLREKVRKIGRQITKACIRDSWAESEQRSGRGDCDAEYTGAGCVKKLILKNNNEGGSVDNQD